MRGWIDEVSEGRLRGRMWTIGTPTFRVRHEVITNIPAVDSPWGKELRSLLIAEDGYKIVGADSPLATRCVDYATTLLIHEFTDMR